MKKRFGILMTLGVLALASCGEGSPPRTPPVNPGPPPEPVTAPASLGALPLDSAVLLPLLPLLPLPTAPVITPAINCPVKGELVDGKLRFTLEAPCPDDYAVVVTLWNVSVTPEDYVGGVGFHGASGAGLISLPETRGTYQARAFGVPVLTIEVP